jgi:lysophospholipase L1-like esterase
MPGGRRGGVAKGIGARRRRRLRHQVSELGSPSLKRGSDKIHPNTSGHTFMANRSYAAIEDLLPK